MDKIRVTSRTIDAYERHCETLSFDMENIAERLLEFSAKWQSLARPYDNDQEVTTALADILKLTAHKIRFSGEHERAFVESQKVVRRMRREQKEQGHARP